MIIKASAEEMVLIRKNIEAIGKWFDTVKSNVRATIMVPLHYDVYDIKFYAESEECFLVVGNNVKYFRKTAYHNGHFDLLANDVEFSMLVLDNWKMIKEKVMNEIDQQSSRVSDLTKFEV